MGGPCDLSGSKIVDNVWNEMWSSKRDVWSVVGDQRNTSTKSGVTLFFLNRRRVPNLLDWTNPSKPRWKPGKNPYGPHRVTLVDSIFDSWRGGIGVDTKTFSSEKGRNSGPDHSTNPLGLNQVYHSNCDMLDIWFFMQDIYKELFQNYIDQKSMNRGQ